MRLLNRIYAWLFGYFWLPCPACGDMFGGHEVTMQMGGKQYETGKIFCPSCAHEDMLRNPIRIDLTQIQAR